MSPSRFGRKEKGETHRDRLELKERRRKRKSGERGSERTAGGGGMRKGRKRDGEAGAQRRRRRLNEEEKGKDFGTLLSPLIASPSFPRNVQHALEPSPRSS